MKHRDVNDRMAKRRANDVNQLRTIVEQWLQAETEGRDGEADRLAGVALRDLPLLRPSQDLSALVLARVTPVGVWARTWVHYLVGAALLVLGLGLTTVAGSASGLWSVARLPVWSDLAKSLVVQTLDIGFELVVIADKVVQMLAGIPGSTTVWSVLPWVAMTTFVAGAIALAILSSWTEKQRWNHA